MKKVRSFALPISVRVCGTLMGLSMLGVSGAALADNHGDAERGKLLYATCIACHQADARGNELLNAPNLRGLQDWYIKRQLENFSSGVRGSTRDDVYGQQMRPMAQQLKTDQDRLDVIAYIKSLD